MNKSKKFRQIETYENYFESFFLKQNQKIRDKILWTFELIEDIEHVPKTYLDHIEGKLYEIRVKHVSNIFRIFCFFDDVKLVVVINSFQKKSQKTPINEIKKAKAIMDKYFKNKSA